MSPACTVRGGRARRLAGNDSGSEKRDESMRVVSRLRSKNTSFIGRICPVNV
jgi:hypothetical protein